MNNPLLKKQVCRDETVRGGLVKEKGVVSRMISWLSEKCPFYVEVRNLNAGDIDAPAESSAEVGIKIRF